MTRQLILKSDGSFALWSDGIDDFVADGFTAEQYIEWAVQQAAKEALHNAHQLIDELRRGGNPYYQFKMTYEQCVRMREREHGKAGGT
jgi:serine/threonine protein phosphatase PrpC